MNLQKRTPNVCFLSTESYSLYVPENHRLNEKIDTLKLEDKDQIQNKDPRFSVLSGYREIFNVEVNDNKDGNLVLKKVGKQQKNFMQSFHYKHVHVGVECVL